MEIMNDVYKKNQLFYWHNSSGEVNMPGDGEGLYIHAFDELPLTCQKIFNQYFSDDGECSRYVVSLEGKVGLLLVALYGEYEVGEICGFYPNDKDPKTADKVRIAMEICAFILKQRVACMEADPVFDGCTLLFGDYTDPIGHEVALFIPESELGRFSELEDIFLQGCWFSEDKKRLANTVNVLLKEEEG